MSTFCVDPTRKPTLAYLTSLRLRLAVMRAWLACACWLSGTTVAEVRRLRDLTENVA